MPPWPSVGETRLTLRGRASAGRERGSMAGRVGEEPWPCAGKLWWPHAVGVYTPIPLRLDLGQKIWPITRRLMA